MEFSCPANITILANPSVADNKLRPEQEASIWCIPLEDVYNDIDESVLIRDPALVGILDEMFNDMVASDDEVDREDLRDKLCQELKELFYNAGGETDIGDNVRLTRLVSTTDKGYDGYVIQRL